LSLLSLSLSFLFYLFIFLLLLLFIIIIIIIMIFEISNLMFSDWILFLAYLNLFEIKDFVVVVGRFYWYCSCRPILYWSTIQQWTPTKTHYFGSYTILVQSNWGLLVQTAEATAQSVQNCRLKIWNLYQ
jgi:hypothetical protein